MSMPDSVSEGKVEDVAGSCHPLWRETHGMDILRVLRQASTHRLPGYMTRDKANHNFNYSESEIIEALSRLRTSVTNAICTSHS